LFGEGTGQPTGEENAYDLKFFSMRGKIGVSPCSNVDPVTCSYIAT
jgi:hypothetical protein